MRSGGKKRRLPKVAETPIADAFGYCYRDLHLIEIDPAQGARCYLDTIVHEMLHYVDPQRSEAWVERNATLIADVLWRQGYRRKRTR